MGRFSGWTQSSIQQKRDFEVDGWLLPYLLHLWFGKKFLFLVTLKFAFLKWARIQMSQFDIKIPVLTTVSQLLSILEGSSHPEHLLRAVSSPQYSGCQTYNRDHACTAHEQMSNIAFVVYMQRCGQSANKTDPIWIVAVNIYTYCDSGCIFNSSNSLD